MIKIPLSGLFKPLSPAFPFEDFCRLGLSDFYLPQSGLRLSCDEGQYIIEADVPGFEKQDIKASLEKSVLDITAKRETTEESGQQNRFTRYLVVLPEDAITDAPKTCYENGVLTLRFERKELEVPTSEAKQIEIK